MPTYKEATDQLPADAKWSSSFGNPGEGAYCEYYRDAAGKRYIIANGDSYLDSAPFWWTCKSVEV